MKVWAIGDQSIRSVSQPKANAATLADSCSFSIFERQNQTQRANLGTLKLKV